MEQAFNDQVRPKLDAIHRIRPYLKDENVELPAIVVVGDQSAGKTSLLESLSRVNLPRGEEIVTRCPLQLQLRQGKQHASIRYDNPQNPEKAYIKEDIALERIAEEVRDATNILCGKEANIKNLLITLQVSRPDAPTLTLIDLPGIVRVRTGDQPDDIEDQVEKLILHHAAGLLSSMYDV
ncbi:hypothetical protein WJX73_009822 [Symbiochloris irregularis]|uniref:Dynamin-type G domain-containing protein n=1 Tax=Symbiochloris irregularis TaxID=706552 RepID=A0AAW1PQV5_9CHLO